MAAAQKYGITPWGRWFAEALADFDESGRLSRGKSYANTGKVPELRFEGCSAIAKVKGHSSPWYKVRIDFPPLGEGQAARLFGLIETEPMLLSRIESGELPEELLDRMKAAKIDLIPRSWRSMNRSCSCPDWGDPCKHMAAVYYLIAQEIDRDPSLLFRLRGVDLAARFGRAHAPIAVGLPFGIESAPDPRPKLPNESPNLSAIEGYLGFVTALIPPRPPFAETDFGAVLVEFYHRAARDEAIASAAPIGRSRMKGEPGHTELSLERRFSESDFRIESDAGAERFPFRGGREPVLVVSGPRGGSRTFSVAAAMELFLDFEDERGTSGYRFLFHLARLLRAAWRASAFVPAPYLDGDELRVLWQALPAAKDLACALEELAAYDPGLYHSGSRRVSGLSCARIVAAAAFGEWVRRTDFRPAGERAAQRPLVELFFHGCGIDASKPGERLLPQSIAAWLSVFNIDFGAAAYRYRFDVDEIPCEAESDLRFRVGLSVLPAQGTEAAGPVKPIALKDAAKKLGDFDVLRIPTALSAYVPEIRRLASEKSIVLEEERLGAFMGDAASLLRRLGVEVVLPKALKKALAPRLVLDVKSSGSGSLRSYLDLDTVLSYDWRIAIGDELLSPAAFERLVRGKKDIVLFHDGFVRLEASEIARLLEKAKAGAKPSALDLIAARLSGGARFSADAEELAASLFREREEELPSGLDARLRPYQEAGYRWIMSNLRAGFGCILADDMGLGKTVQAIAVILRLAEEGLLAEGALVVAPAALVTNWEREMHRFAPGLPVALYHGPRRSLPEGATVSLTTYETAARDSEKLSSRNFSVIVCDEAHLMKNSGTRRSRAIKSLGSAHVLALSGTPVENRLEDLRSLFDFVLPGYLGGPAEFKRKFRAKIEVDRDPEAAERLKRITSPFLMRRLKSDRAIIPDLPDKISSDEYAKLAPEQAALYESVVRSGLAEAAEVRPGPERAALVLKLLTSLKQICDHPRVYDKESPPSAALSGKCLLLVALLEEILGRREKALIFSQYVEAIELLQTVIRDELGEDCILYHGGMSKKARDEAVADFQGEGGSSLMLVSLKAGGLGLNLTAASRVIHYDLWFNPAVENQATDRAFRIGQTKNVFVHRLITAGSFEERIDEMLKDKRELADMSVASGESWIAKMSAQELGELFSR
jgi:superfamily II DNA or RNA helicase